MVGGHTGIGLVWLNEGFLLKISMTRGWSTLVLLALLALLAAGCGDDDESTSGDTGITSVDDLGGVIVGAQDGTTGETYANDETDAGEVRGFPEGPDALAALSTGQVEAVIIDLPVAAEAIETQGGFEVAEEITTNELYGFAVAEDNPGLRAEMNTALQEMKDDGTLTELYQQYFVVDPPDSVLDGTNELADPPAEGETPTLIEEGVLTIGLDTPYSPFAVGQPPDASGYDVDVMDAIAERIGLTPEYTDTSFETIFGDVQSGRYDTAAAASTITPGRENAVDFTDPYYEAQQALVIASE